MLSLLLACFPGPDADDDAQRRPRDTAATDGDADTDSDADGDADADSDADTDTDTDADTTPAEPAVCERWNDGRSDLSEARWSGSVSDCEEGDMDSSGRARALEVLNVYRFLAGLPEVTDQSSQNDAAQSCALMMDANNTLSHSPPSSWRCYSSSGANAAGSSNIASGPAVMAMDMYMQDWGNETTIGHRRWILSNSLGPIGIGSTDSYSCLQVIGGSGSAGKSWVAWPPGGEFPIQAVTAGGWYTVDETGWTIQSDSIDLSRAEVTVTDGGTERRMKVETLLAYYGSTYAIKMTPQGWSSQAGHTYHVEVAGVSATIEYDVEMVDCG